MASTSTALSPLIESDPAPALPPSPVRSLDAGMLLGIAIALGATIAGIAATGVHLTYFLQPTGALIVLGGTLGVTLITTPRNAARNSARHVRDLFRPATVSRERLIEEMVSYAKAARMKGLLSIEPAIAQASHRFLRDMLALAVDVRNRGELQAALETKLRLRDRQGEADAKVLEVAGGFAPTIGVLGTVVGLIDVLRQFSSVSAVALGIGTAFVSTIYGLALANLVLLPAAHRIRASAAETFETEEMMVEGGLCLYDGIHPALLRERLNSFLRPKDGR